MWIHGYGYMPDEFYYFGGGQKDLLLGVGLDVEMNTDSRDVGEDLSYEELKERLKVENEEHASKVRGILNCDLFDKEHVYIKESNMLDWCGIGFRIVSHPATLEYHLSSIPWEQAFKYLIKNNYHSEYTLRCGMHIHINKGYLGDTPEEIILNEEKLLYFFERYWCKLVAMSRRDEDEIYEYCARRGYTDIIRAIKDVVDEDGEPRFYAVDFGKEHSVEVRLFKGTLTYKTFVATLMLVARIVEFCKDRPIRKLMSWRKFQEFLLENKESNSVLIEYMKKCNVWL